MHKPDTVRHGYNPMENYLKITGLTINQITLLSQSEINPNMSEYPSAKGVKFVCVPKYVYINIIGTHI